MWADTVHTHTPPPRPHHPPHTFVAPAFFGASVQEDIVLPVVTMPSMIMNASCPSQSVLCFDARHGRAADSLLCKRPSVLVK